MQASASPRRGSIQTKLIVGDTNDPAEAEADQIADRVIAALDGTTSKAPERGAAEGDPSLRRGAPTGETAVRRSAPIGAAGGAVDDATRRGIDRARGSGKELPGPLRRSMESTLDADLSGVRVHTGDNVDDLNSRLSARAFTLGSDVFVRRSEYRPASRDGQRLLAHEVAHTVQQEPERLNRSGESSIRRSPAKVIRRLADRNELADAVSRLAYDLHDLSSQYFNGNEIWLATLFDVETNDNGYFDPEQMRAKISQKATYFLARVEHMRKNQSTAHEVYGEAQRIDVQVKQHLLGKKIISAKVGSGDEGAQAFEFVTMDIDQRASRLAALLTEKTGTKGQDRFKAVMHLLAGGNAEQLKERYQLIRGDARRTLVKDIERTYKGNSLRISYLKQLLDEGRPSPEGRMALKLGLLYGRWTPADLKDKDRIRTLVREAPEDFTWLLDDSDGSNELKQEIRKSIKGTGFLGELRAYLQTKDDIADPSLQGDATVQSTEPHANYLWSLIKVLEQRSWGWDNEYWTIKDDKRIDWRSIHVKGLRDSLLDWVNEMAPDDDRDAFVAAGIAVYRMKLTPPSDVDDSKKSEFRKVWRQIESWNLMVPEKARFVIQVASGKGTGTASDPQNRLNELEATLQFHHDDNWAPTRRMARSDMKHFVMQQLSAGDHLSPMTALIERYHPDGPSALQPDDDDDGGLTKFEFRRVFGEAFTEFEKVLDLANITGDQKIQIKTFLLQEGKEDLDGNNVGVYLKLKKKQRDFTSSHSTDRILELIATMKPGSKDAQLVTEDSSLLNWIYYSLAGHDEKVAIWKKVRDSVMSRSRPQDFWAARLAASHKLDHDGNRGLEIAWEAQGEGVDGSKVRTSLERLYPEAHRVMAERGSRFRGLSRIAKHLDQRGERSAYKVLHHWLQNNDEIRAEDLFHAARARTKLGVHSEEVDFALESITAENVFDYVHEGTLKLLRTRADDRFAKRLELQKLRQQDDRKSRRKIPGLEKDIATLTESIQKTDLEIGSDLVRKMGKVMRRGALGAAKRRIYGLMGLALGADADDDVETHDSVQQLKLNEGELGFKSAQMQGKAEVLEQRSLESGVTWEHRTTIAPQTSESLGVMMGKMRNAEQEMMKLDAKERLTDEDRSRRKQMLTELKSAQAEVTKFQKDFKEAQDRLNAQTVKIITTLLSLAITVAGFATGLGAALGVIQLAWAIGASVVQSAVKYGLEAALGRQGEHSKAESAKGAIVQLFGDVLAATIAAELTLAIDLSLLGANTGGPAAELFGKPALAMAKSQVSKAVGSVPGAVEHELFAKHPLQGLIPSIRQGIVDKAKALPTELVTTYVTGFAAEGFRLGGKALFESLGIPQAAWAPSGGLGPNQYIAQQDNGEFNTDNADKGLAQFFGRGGDASGNWMRGDTADWFNSWGIFVGSPTSDVGADTTALAPGGGDYDASNLPGYLLTSVKTVFYEEFVVAKLKESVGRRVGQVMGGSAIGQQSSGLADGYGLDHEDDSTTSATVPRRDVQAELDALDEDDEVSTVAVDADEVSLRLMADMYRDWGLRIEEDTDDAIKDALGALPKKQRATALSQYTKELAATKALIEELNKRIKKEQRARRQAKRAADKAAAQKKGSGGSGSKAKKKPSKRSSASSGGDAKKKSSGSGSKPKSGSRN